MQQSTRRILTVTLLATLHAGLHAGLSPAAAQQPAAADMPAIAGKAAVTATIEDAVHEPAVTAAQATVDPAPPVASGTSAETSVDAELPTAQMPADLTTVTGDEAGAQPPAAEQPPPAENADTSTQSEADATSELPTGSVAEDAAPEPDPAAAGDSEQIGPFTLLGQEVAPGTRKELVWRAGETFAGGVIETPVIVIRGVRPGPTLCLTAAIHGDELNGVEIVRRVMARTDPSDLAGTLIGAPIVNLLGFSRGSRYLPDRRDLNRYFPGNPHGSLASRIAMLFFTQVASHCGHLVDFHTGSFKRTNLPQLRANLSNAAVRTFAQRFGATSVLHKPGGAGTLRAAATAIGIPAITFELGEPGTLQLHQVAFGVKALETLLDELGMVSRLRLWSNRQQVFYASQWLRAQQGGILTSTARVGMKVEIGDVLAKVTNPVTNARVDIVSPHNGRLLGRALNQFVLPGFAAFHIGLIADDMDDPRVRAGAGNAVLLPPADDADDTDDDGNAAEPGREFPDDGLPAGGNPAGATGIDEELH